MITISHSWRESDFDFIEFLKLIAVRLFLFMRKRFAPFTEEILTKSHLCASLGKTREVTFRGVRVMSLEDSE